MIAVLLVWPGGREAAAAGGFYVNVTLAGSELKAPKQTPGTDVGLFRGLGLAPAIGFHRGRFRVEGEAHVHASGALLHSDTVGVRALMANCYFDMELPRRFVIFLGAGLGMARVHVDFGTCLDEGGCPVAPDTNTTESATAHQFMLGVAWSPVPRHQIFVGYRRFRTRDLGLVDANGSPFVEGHLDMPTALIGYRFDR